MSLISQEAPKSSLFQTHSFIVIKLTIPSKLFSEPIGMLIGKALAPVLSLIMLTQLK